MTPDESVTVKGSPVRSLQKFVEQDLTPAQREAVFRSLPPEYRTRLESVILPTETVPVHMLNRFTEEAAKAKGESLDSFARRAGQEGASEAIRGIYRFFALVLTPAALLSKAGNMWGSLYNQGKMVVEDQTDHSARIALRDFPSELAGCTRVTGWIERLAEMTGAKDVDVKQKKCFARGDANCEWELHWK